MYFSNKVAPAVVHDEAQLMGGDPEKDDAGNDAAPQSENIL